MLEAGFAATAVEHVTQLGRKVGTLAQQGVTAAAVVGLINMLAPDHRFGQLIGIGTLGDGFFCVVCQCEKYQNEEQTASIVNISRHTFGECFRHDAMPPEDICRLIIETSCCKHA